jgi:hypothetical protein
VFARRLATLCQVPVTEVTRQTVLEGGNVYIARGDADIVFTKTVLGMMALPAPASATTCGIPSVTRMVESAMNAAAARPADRRATDRHGRRRRQGDGERCGAVAAVPSPRTRPHRWCSACRGNWSACAVPMPSCRPMPSPTTDVVAGSGRGDADIHAEARHGSR